MRKALRLIAVLAAFGLTAWIGVVALAQGSSAPSTSTTTSAVSTGGEDLEGNCDEAEHANDPECVGVNPAVDDDQGDVNDDDQGDLNDDQGENEDNDDQGENEDNDDQGENEDNDDQGEDQGDDDQGDNSGPGSENSGPGSEDSGSGSGS